MDLLKHGMKGPTRPAPTVPVLNGVNRYSPVTNWNDDPFGADVFEPTPQYGQKKKPPPRPPPPKLSRQPEIPAKPSHFIRKPTVLSALLSRKSKSTLNQSVVNQHNVIIQQNADFNSEVDASKMFPKCDTRNIQTGALIDLSSPPSSPTFTTRSSSDGLSVDSFGSDATTSTNHHNHFGGNISQPESGFEDDFDLFLNNRKQISKEDTLDDLVLSDPFSPQPIQKPPVMKKPVISRDPYELPSNVQSHPVLKGPTIIRAKPARPKPPENTAVLKNTFGSNFSVTSMNVNTTVPIQKVSSSLIDAFDSKPFSWDHDSSPEREASPPMPTIPPPPPPPIDDDVIAWPEDQFLGENLLEQDDVDSKVPQAVALFDYYTDHDEDLCFSANTTIYLVRRVNEEWLCGRLKSGVEGLFPSNYVEVKVPLPNDSVVKPTLGVATALYDFEPVQQGDLRFTTGDRIQVMHKLNDEWYFGECHGIKGQFPGNYVQMS